MHVHAGYLFVTDTLSTPTITEPPSIKCQDLLIQTRWNACVARIDLGLKSHPSDWGISPLLKGITQWPTEIVFSAITNCAFTVSLEPNRLPWPLHNLFDYDSCAISCCRGLIWVPSDYQSDALSNRPSVPISSGYTSHTCSFNSTLVK